MLVFTVVSDAKMDELVPALKACQKNMFPGEHMMHTFISVEFVLM